MTAPAELLRECREKLRLYRENSNGEYLGGVEYTDLIRRLDAALSEPVKEAPTMPHRRVVCAAIRSADGQVLLGVRHYSADMHAQLHERMDRLKFIHRHDEDQGFVDQHGVYMGREEAYQVAKAAGQIVRPEACGEGLDGPKLYSEGLY